MNGLEIDGRNIKVELAHGAGSSRGGGGREPRGGERSNVCYDWLRGRCDRGDSCRFDHFKDGEGPSGRGGDRRDDRRDDRRGDDRRRDDRRDDDRVCPACLSL